MSVAAGLREAFLISHPHGGGVSFGLGWLVISHVLVFTAGAILGVWTEKAGRSRK